MKKMIGLLFVITCLTAPVQAQWLRWGAKAAWSISNPKFNDEIYKTGKRTGYYIGPTVDMSLPLGGLGVDASVFFSQRSIRGGEYSTRIKTLKQNGIEIPINLKYTFDVGEHVGVYVATGPNLYVDFSGDKKTFNNTFENKSPQLGLNIGFGAKVIDHVLFNVNYVLPLGNTAEFGDYSYKTRTWQIGLGYLF